MFFILMGHCSQSLAELMKSFQRLFSFIGECDLQLIDFSQSLNIMEDFNTEVFVYVLWSASESEIILLLDQCTVAWRRSSALLDRTGLLGKKRVWIYKLVISNF